jgi:hypothetical protein
MELRQFAYRDDPLVREFLAQLEGGVFDEDTTVQRSGKRKGASGRASLGPVGASADVGRDYAEESRRTTKQTGASEFERLHQLLEQREAIQFLDAIDDNIWSQLRRGEIVEIEAVVQPTGLQKVAELFTTLQQLLPFAQAAGVEETLDSEAMTILTFIRDLANANPRDSVPIIVSLASTPKYKFAAQLRTDHLVAGEELLEGEVTVLGKIARKLREGETYMVGAVFAGLEQMLDDKSQRELAEVFEKPEVRALGLASPRLEHPAATLTPIALYR